MMIRLCSIVLTIVFWAAVADATTPQIIHAFVLQWDLNRDGKISFEEFQTQALKSKSRPTTKTIKEAFHSYDLNGDGVITESEMQTVNRRANLENRAGKK